MLAPILGFLGGLAAVALSGFVQLIIESRRERRALRAALRLLEDEYEHAVAAIRNVLEQGRWWETPDDPVETAWTESRELLALSVSRSDWYMLIAAREHVRNFAMRTHIAALEERTALDDDERRELERRTKVLNVVIKRLGALDEALPRWGLLPLRRLPAPPQPPAR